MKYYNEEEIKEKIVQILLNKKADTLLMTGDPLCNPGFLKLKSGTYGALVDGDNFIPFYIKKFFGFFNVLYFSSRPQISDDFDYSSIKSALSKSNIDAVAQPMASGFSKGHPQNSNYIPFGTYLKDINMEDEELLASFHKKHRNVVKKAQKSEYSVNNSEEPEVIYNLLVDTMARQGLSTYPKSYIQGLSTVSNFYSLTIDGVIQGMAIIPANKKRAFYLHGGSISKTMPGALNLLHYEIMKDLRDKGIYEYDLMGARINVAPGSKYEGIQRFKSRFGTELIEGFLWKQAINLKGKLFFFLLRVNNFIKNKKFSGDLIDELS